MLSLLCLLTLAGPALAQDDESELYMADMGVTAVLPDGWTVPRWSDWDLDAVDRAKTVQVHVEYTHLQVPPSPEAAKVWVGMAADRLRDQGHERVEMASTEVVEIDGRPTAEFELTYRYKGDQDAVYYQRSFNVDSRTVHLSATAVRRNARRAEEALATWDDTLQIEKPPQDLSALPQEVASEAGFASLLPPAGARPLNGELGVVRQVAADAGQGSLDKEKCWWGMHPYPDGEAAVLLACSYSLYTGVVDEHSWTGMEQQMRDHFFKGVEVPAAERVATGADQRFSFLYTLPDVGDRAVRMAATPYDRGHVLTYAIGKTGDTGTLDGAIRAVLVSTTFDDPEGGKHPIGALQWMEYYWTYRKTSPVVWGPILLLVGFFGFIIMKARSKPSYDDLLMRSIALATLALAAGCSPCEVEPAPLAACLAPTDPAESLPVADPLFIEITGDVTETGGVFPAGGCLDGDPELGEGPDGFDAPDARWLRIHVEDTSYTAALLTPGLDGFPVEGDFVTIRYGRAFAEDGGVPAASFELRSAQGGLWAWVGQAQAPDALGLPRELDRVDWGGRACTVTDGCGRAGQYDLDLEVDGDPLTLSPGESGVAGGLTATHGEAQRDRVGAEDACEEGGSVVRVALGR